LRQFDDDEAKPQKHLQHWPRVVAIVPARNEAEMIGQTVASLAKQEYSGEFSILIVDDHSNDETAKLAQKAAQESGAAERVIVLTAAALPPEWTGKLWALNEGVTNATKEKEPPEFFWFTDADIVHTPDTLHRLVSRAEQNHLDLTSLMVLLQAKTMPERLLVPPFLYFFLMLYPPQWIANPKSRIAGAAGGCILLRRRALERIGGLAAIRKEVIDDCALARATKKSRGKIWMGLTRASISLRSYSNFGEIRDLIARTAFTQLRYSPGLLLGTLIGLFTTYLLAWIMAFAANGSPRLIGATTALLMAISFLPTVRFYRLSPLWALTLPLAATFYGYATWLSAVRYWRSQGGQWKGRAQAPKN
jgi:hopene-associated glycosyltransferase HpnB